MKCGILRNVTVLKIFFKSLLFIHKAKLYQHRFSVSMSTHFGYHVIFIINILQNNNGNNKFISPGDNETLWPYLLIKKYYIKNIVEKYTNY